MKKIMKQFLIRIRNEIYIFKEERGLGGKSCYVSQVTHCVGANIGDTVLSHYTRRLFEKNRIVNKWNIITVEKPVNNGTIDSINRGNALIIGGGGLFLPDTNKNSASGWIWAIETDQINELEKPIVIFAVGYNFFRGQKIPEAFIDSLNHLIERAYFVGLRNSGSIECVKNLVHDELKNKIVYQPCATALIKKIDPKIKCTCRTDLIAFNVAFDREELRFNDKQDIILDQIALSASVLSKRGYKIIYVAHCSDDMKFVKYLESYKFDFRIVNLSYKTTWSAIEFYRNVSVVIGMRGHAQMIPFGLNRQIITLGSHDKMRWFLQDICADDWYVELQDSIFTIKDRIIDIFIKNHEIDYEKTNRRLLDQQNKLWKITKNNIRKIAYELSLNKSK